MKKLGFLLLLVSKLAVGFGVIAYSPGTFRAGYAEAVSYPKAVLDALGFCRAVDCRVVTCVNGGCAALAAGTPWAGYGTHYAVSLQNARAGALGQCEARAEQCRIVAQVCSP